MWPAHSPSPQPPPPHKTQPTSTCAYTQQQQQTNIGNLIPHAGETVKFPSPPLLSINP